MIRTSLEGLAGSAETVIVGSGPAGLTVALELARLGRRSLVLESGLTRPGAAQALSDADLVDPLRHDAMAIAVARRYGGTSNLWGGRCVPLDPTDFEPRPYAGEARWPIRFADLEPYYEAACRYASCGAPIFTAQTALVDDNDDFTCHRLERASNIPRFQVAHRGTLETSPLIDLRLGASVVDVALDEAGTATRAIVANADGTRVPIATKRLVLAAGGLESTRLLLALQRRHAELFGGADGPLGRFYMGHLIGEIADITFADERLDAAFDFFRDGNGSFVRRRFTPSPALQRRNGLPNICFWPVVPPIADPSHGSGALSAVALALSTPGLGKRLIPEAIRSRHLHGPIDVPAHLRNVLRGGPEAARFLSRFVVQRYLATERIHGYFLRNRARRYGLSYSSEQSPRPESRARLGAATDRLGLPRLTIDLRFHHEDAEAVVRAHDALAHWLAATNRGCLVFREPDADPVEAVLRLASHGTHQIGSARMGTDRRNGVVDGDLRCFDIPNLFLASSATFPTSGQANPTLTVLALAARLAEMLARAS